MYKDSLTGQKILELAMKAGDDAFTMLYQEKGIYNFYLQGEDYRWKRFNYDSGAGETAMPPSVGPEQRFPPRQARRP